MACSRLLIFMFILADGREKRFFFRFLFLEFFFDLSRVTIRP